MAKIQVHELARQMGVGDRELMFLLQSIGVQVNSPHADLDDSTVQAILQGIQAQAPPEQTVSARLLPATAEATEVTPVEVDDEVEAEAATA